MKFSIKVSSVNLIKSKGDEEGDDEEILNWKLHFFAVTYIITARRLLQNMRQISVLRPGFGSCGFLKLRGITLQLDY